MHQAKKLRIRHVKFTKVDVEVDKVGIAKEMKN